MANKVLGVLGGLGPQATVYFSDMVVRYTEASRDQEHIPMIILNDTEIPDRTDFILGVSDESPLPKMISDAKLLESAGCSFIVIPCNTAHFFYDEIEKNVSVPIINIIDETVRHCVESTPGIKAIGLLATEGTVQSGAYKKYTDKYGLELMVPEEEDEKKLMSIIYDQVKAGKSADIFDFSRIVSNLKRRGADVVVLGCTELSIINREYGLTQRDPEIKDSMEILVARSIEKCGKTVIDEFRLN
ncbi:MAG: amino acid racemase [Eubacterium sp.]|nr:amino acid racemase [Eubacterium sp.]